MFKERQIVLSSGKGMDAFPLLLLSSNTGCVSSTFIRLERILQTFAVRFNDLLDCEFKTMNLFLFDEIEIVDQSDKQRIKYSRRK